MHDLVVASNLTDIYPNPLESGHIVLNKSLLNTYMGKVLRDEEVVSILERFHNTSNTKILIFIFNH